MPLLRPYSPAVRGDRGPGSLGPSVAIPPGVQEDLQGTGTIYGPVDLFSFFHGAELWILVQIVHHPAWDVLKAFVLYGNLGSKEVYCPHWKMQL